MDKENASHIMVLTTLQGLCELAKTELFKRKIARTTITKTKDDRYFFESVAIHDWNCDPKSNPNNAANADNVHEFMNILKQQEYYEYVRKKFNSDIGGSEVVEKLYSPDADTLLGLEPVKLIPILNEGHILSSDELTALGISKPL